MQEGIEIGDEAFVSDGEGAIGAVRKVLADSRQLVIYVENVGDFYVPFDAVEAIHAQKVILSCDRLDDAIRAAIGHAHDAEAGV